MTTGKSRDRGLMSMSGNTGRRRIPAKKIGSAGPVVADGTVTESWLNLAFDERYTDRRKLWGGVLPSGWRPSGMGEACDRKSVLGMLGYRGELIDVSLRRIFDMGNQVETLWRKYFLEMGVLLSSNVRIKSGSDPVVSGEYDMMVKHPYEPNRKLIVEVKSINTAGFAKLPPVTMDSEINVEGLTTISDKRIGVRIKNYVLQLQVYLRLTSLAEGILLFSNKNDSKYADFYMVQVPEMVDAEFSRLRFRDGFRTQLIVPPCSCLGAREGLCLHFTGDEVPLAAMQELTEELGMT